MAQINKPDEYFNTVLYTGDGSASRDITVGFQPDWVWVKCRSSAENHTVADSVRGGSKNLEPNLTNAERTFSTVIPAFVSNGFTVGSSDYVNGNTKTYASWNWLAGTSVSGNTGGSGTAKTYSGSVNTTSGFSIINFVGNGTAGHTIPHHLGVAPKMVIVKNRTSGSTSWQTYHYNLDNGAGTNEIFLDDTGATNASAGAWNNTAPTSTVITKGTGSYGNENNSNHIMYSFAEKKGFSKFGSYTGNGSTDGTFVYTGFKPAFLMIKCTTNSAFGNSNWMLYDNKRDPDNQMADYIYPNLSNAGATSSNGMDFLSNGIKMRNNFGDANYNNETYIYMAFAENPLVGTNNIPATAR